MNRYTFEFYGRTRGALGVSSRFVVTVEGETREDAELRLYDTHDHLMGTRLVDFWSPGMPSNEEEA